MHGCSTNIRYSCARLTGLLHTRRSIATGVGTDAQAQKCASHACAGVRDPVCRGRLPLCGPLAEVLLDLRHTKSPPTRVRVFSTTRKSEDRCVPYRSHHAAV